MKQTENYQLNQWEKPDRILMDDFNADNAKIDGALKANAAAISAEETARKTAVSAEEAARKTAVTAEANTRAAAVNTVNTRLTSEASRLENLGSFRLIKTHTDSAGGTAVTIPTSGVDWDKWNVVAVVPDRILASGFVGLNGFQTGECKMLASSSMTPMLSGNSNGARSLSVFTSTDWVYLLFPMRNSAAVSTCLGLGPGLTIGQGLCYNQITGISFIGNGSSIPAGLTAKIWGLR